MKNGVWVLDHDTGFRNTKKDLVIRYGNMPGLEFKRTGTIGKGADKCDFCPRRK